MIMYHNNGRGNFQNTSYPLAANVENTAKNKLTIIPEGMRNQTMFRFAERILKKKAIPKRHSNAIWRKAKNVRLRWMKMNSNRYGGARRKDIEKEGRKYPQNRMPTNPFGIYWT